MINVPRSPNTGYVDRAQTMTAVAAMVIMKARPAWMASIEDRRASLTEVVFARLSSGSVSGIHGPI